MLIVWGSFKMKLYLNDELGIYYDNLFEENFIINNEQLQIF